MESLWLFPPNEPVVVSSERVTAITEVVRSLLDAGKHPSAWELVEAIEDSLGHVTVADMNEVLAALIDDKSMPRVYRDYLRWIAGSPDLRIALDGEPPPRRGFESSLDDLFQSSRNYRGTAEFQEMIGFMARFREYAPFNVALVKLQNPSCGFFATQKAWKTRFRRSLKEDARPMVILAPMHPVLLVYDLDQTEGEPLPKALTDFAQFQGEWNPSVLYRTLENAAERDSIRVNFKPLSSTYGGFATCALGDPKYKMRIAIHESLDEASRYGVLCHELAHIYLGHLGSDADGWWPTRRNLDQRTVEVEAEAVAYIVTSRAGLMGSSPKYISGYLAQGQVPAAVSLDLIAKVAGRIEEMGRRRYSPRKPRGG